LSADMRILFTELSLEGHADAKNALRSDPGLIINEDPSPLDSWLSPELSARAAAWLSPLGITPEAAAMLKPGMLLLMMATPPCLLASQPEDGFMDQQIAQHASAAGVDTRGLEEWTDQLGFFLDRPTEEQQQMLRWSLLADVDRDIGRVVRKRLYIEEKIMLIWTVGLEIARALNPSPQIEEAAAKFWKELIIDRNLKMAEVATPELNKGGVMIAVGALHLPSKNGLVELFRSRGFAVERVR